LRKNRKLNFLSDIINEHVSDFKNFKNRGWGLNKLGLLIKEYWFLGLRFAAPKLAEEKTLVSLPRDF